jgi:hypothetical protein
MADATQYVFSYRELVEILIRQQGLKEGIWGISVRFGLQATNIGPSDDQLLPAAIVALLEVGLQKVDKLTNLSVDAADLARQDAAARRH